MASIPRFLSTAEVAAYCPILDCRPNARHPVLGASLQRRGGVARHDAVAWGYARAADSRGVDIIQNCEVTGFRIEEGRIKGVETTRGFIGAGKVGCVAAGHSSVMAKMAGLRFPIESHPLQALVSEPIKPVLEHGRDVERGPCLCQPVRQGRAGHGRRHRRLQFLCPERQPAGGGESAERA